MIRRFIITTAAAATLIAGPAATGALAAPVAGTPAGSAVALAAMATPPPQRGHGPGWDGRHGNWDGRSGPGHGGGWDGVGGGWDGQRWWVSPDRCRVGHGRVIRDNRWRTNSCQGGTFNRLPVRF
jgi:hypothetical protein